MNMPEFQDLENVEIRNERIVSSLTNTIRKILEEKGFFSALPDDVGKNDKLLFLELSLSELLINENLATYLAGSQLNDQKVLEIINDLRNKILLKISSLFVPGNDSVGLFNKKCQNVITSLIKKSL